MLRCWWDALRLYLASSSQIASPPWLDYAGARAACAGIVADGHGVAPAGGGLGWRRTFPALRSLESALAAVGRDRT